MNHEEANVLVLHFTCNDSHLEYGFKFQNYRWETFDHEPFNNGLSRVDAGKIMHPLVGKNM
ncbi:MAG: hypothetical protein JWQ28_2780 [Pedobacter sp.]|jgi:hypothetical protein|nr:hypothetical protein [Pedobacter sp.]